MDLTIFSKKHQVLPGNTKIIDIGCIRLSASREKEGWLLSVEDNCPDDDIFFSDEATEDEYFQTGKSNSLLIEPVLPGKPLVFKSNVINILPGLKTTFFLKIPLAFQIYFSKIEPENLLKEITYKRLSNTWFGEPDNGEPAYALGSEYFRDINETEINGLEAICPVTVQNSSTEILNAQRLIIRNENITLYKNDNKIVTSVVNIDYKGTNTISTVNYRYSKIYNGEKQEILANPRNNSGRIAKKINFQFIKNMYKTEQ